MSDLKLLRLVHNHFLQSVDFIALHNYLSHHVLCASISVRFHSHLKMSSTPCPIPTLDRISTLPDSILCHILSFLPTKQSAATSILSKRWNPLWLSVLDLDFEEQSFADFATFRHFVYSVMLLRNITLPIRSFQLKCGNSSGFNPHDVNRYIQAAVQRGIQNLDLDILTPTIKPFKLPQCVLTCNRLTLLKLKGVAIPFPEVNFPFLKLLHLENISFSRGPSFLNLNKFLHGCPVLEDLQIQDLTAPTNMLKVHIYMWEAIDFNGLQLHELVKANIFNAISWDFPLAWVRNAKFLCVELKCRYHCRIPTFLNLTNLKIVFESTFDWPGKWKWMTEVLQNCPKLQNLTICEDSSDHGYKIDDEDWVEPPIVPKCLSSELRTCSLIAYDGIKCEFQFAEYILINAKALHTMKISTSKRVNLKKKAPNAFEIVSVLKGLYYV